MVVGVIWGYSCSWCSSGDFSFEIIARRRRLKSGQHEEQEFTLCRSKTMFVRYQQERPLRMSHIKLFKESVLDQILDCLTYHSPPHLDFNVPFNISIPVLSIPRKLFFTFSFATGVLLSYGNDSSTVSKLEFNVWMYLLKPQLTEIDLAWSCSLLLVEITNCWTTTPWGYANQLNFQTKQYTQCHMGSQEVKSRYV